ncbi:ABC transporter substrate-binding protein [Streptacidiphilus carbonis]|uniref:ABC transporter substrate-binding protein n=1 Tax=Streptacidiphilus carbonis TaxID=105422 RepID=UPI0005AAB360|nr:sugar ABC transporter substrate-binding protein [Streptacidiphilus carbonis]
MLRRSLAAAVTCGMIALTAACGSASSSTASGPVTLNYMIWDAGQKPAYQKSINQFEATHPDIKVNIEVVAWAQYWSKLQTSAAGGDMPDLFWDHLSYLPQLAKRGIVSDLSAKIAADKVDTSVYDPKLLSQWTSGSTVYGLPKDWDSIATVYRSDALKAAAVTAAQLGASNWNTTDGGSFVALLQKLTVDTKGKHPNEAGFDASHVKQYGIALEAPNGQQDWWDFGVQNGCKLQEKAYGTWTVNSPACVAAIKFEQDLMYKWHVAAPGTVTNTPNAAQLPQILAQGTAAITFDGDWDLTSFYAGLPKGGWGATTLPSGPVGSGTVYNGLTDAIYAHTKHPAQAWELEKWLASSTSEKIVADAGTVWPGIPSLTGGFADAWKQKGVDVSAFETETKGTTMGYPLTTTGSAFNTVVLKDLNQVWLNQMAPQAAADDVTRTANAAAGSGN